jgi:beta-galactosidase
MRPNISEKVAKGVARHWRDFIEVSEGVQVEAEFADGHPAIVRHGKVRYLASFFDEAMTRRLFLEVAKEAGLQAQELPEGVRVSRRGALTYVLNYSETPYTIEAARDFVLGQEEVGPQGVAIYRA